MPASRSVCSSRATSSLSARPRPGSRASASRAGTTSGSVRMIGGPHGGGRGVRDRPLPEYERPRGERQPSVLSVLHSAAPPPASASGGGVLPQEPLDHLPLPPAHAPRAVAAEEAEVAAV